jgi:hypothetical protein
MIDKLLFEVGFSVVRIISNLRVGSPPSYRERDVTPPVRRR